jgi:Tfp pilus assembly protein PilN
VKAVNLIPVDARRGSTAPGRSGGAVYVLLGGLAVLVVAIASYVLLQNTISDRQAELSRVKREANAAQATATALAPYRQFAQLRETRVQTVGSLAGSRFDWERTMRDLALVLPQNVWLTSFIGTVTPGINFGDSGVSSSGETGTLRSSQQVPAVELVGCTENQADVARVMARLRIMRGVTHVSLAASEKSDVSTAGASAGSGSTPSAGSDCRNGSRRFPMFSLVVFFQPLPGAPTGSSGGAPSTGAGAGAKSATPSSGGQSVADKTPSTAGAGAAKAANNAGSTPATGGTGK